MLQGGNDPNNAGRLQFPDIRDTIAFISVQLHVQFVSMHHSTNYVNLNASQL